MRADAGFVIAGSCMAPTVIAAAVRTAGDSMNSDCHLRRVRPFALWQVAQ